jgi:glycosyltransferase involved in cell wall biosynthesis
MTAHYHVHGHTFLRNVLFRTYHLLGKYVLRWSLRVATASEYEKSLLVRDFDLPEEKYAVIPNGGKQYPDMKVGRVRGRILYVGRLMPYKNVDKVIDLLAALRNDGRDVYLHIVGTGPDLDRLKAYAAEKKVEDWVKFQGDISEEELAAEYQSASLFVLLSSAEAYGLVVAEALSQGTPCLAAQAAALTEFTKERGCYGVTYPVEMKEVVKMAEELLDHPEKIQVGPFSDKMISWPQVATKYIELYQAALKEWLAERN